MGMPFISCSTLLAVAAVMFSCTPVQAQSPSEDMEVVYRNGRREVKKASPFIGIWETEVIGGPWRIARSEVTMICFAHLAPNGRTMEPPRCPKELPGDVKEDTVLWNDGTTTTGAVIVGGYQNGEVVGQAGRPRRSREEAVYVRFAPANASASWREGAETLERVGAAAAGLPPVARPKGE